MASLSRSGLPVFDAPFIGRQRNLQEVRQIFTSDVSRLVTITGSGGVGKTRLACEAARPLEENFPGGCLFVDMTEQVTLDGVSNSVAIAVGQHLNDSAEAPNRLVGNMLTPLPPTLLILDNFEQAIQHAEITIGLWRSKAPQVRILVTSSTILNLEGENPYTLESLPEPSPELLGSLNRLKVNEAIQLFIDRASRKKLGFHLDQRNAEPIASICRELEGHPLSIVLVAERIKNYPPHILARRLNDKLKPAQSPRKKLRDTIDWSYQLLNDYEKEVFLQICLFHDGFTLESAEEIIRFTEAPPDLETFDILQNLCDHSLLRSSEGA